MVQMSRYYGLAAFERVVYRSRYPEHFCTASIYTDAGNAKAQLRFCVDLASFAHHRLQNTSVKMEYDTNVRESFTRFYTSCDAH